MNALRGRLGTSMAGATRWWLAALVSVVAIDTRGAGLLLGHSFAEVRPFEYYPYPRVLKTHAIREEFKPTFPDELHVISDFNPGTPLVGKSFVNLTLRDGVGKVRIVTRVLGRRGTQLTRVVTDHDVGQDPGKLAVPYEVPRAGERLILETTVGNAQGSDVIRWPIKVPYVHRLYLDRNTIWAGDAPLGASLKLQLGRHTMAKAGLRVRLLRDGEALFESTFEKLEPDKRLIVCKLATRALKPGKYTVMSELAAGDVKSVSRQALEVRAAPHPGVVDVPLRVEEVEGVERTTSPVSGGIPFPDGTLRVEDAARLRVVGASGKSRPAQGRVLATWGPNREWVRWLLVTTQATTRPGETTAARLQAGPGVKAPRVEKPIVVDQKADGSVVVDTGRIRFESRVGGSVFEQLSLDGEPLLREPAKCRVTYIPRFSSQAGLRTPKGSGAATVDPIDPGLSAVTLPPLLDFRPGTPPKGRERAWLAGSEGWLKFDTRGVIWARQDVGGIDLHNLESGCYRATVNVSESLAKIRGAWLRVKVGPEDSVALLIDGEALPGGTVTAKGGSTLRIPLGGRLTPGSHQLAVVVKAGTSGRDSSAGLVSPISFRIPENTPAAALAGLRAEAEDVSETLWGRTTSIEVVEAGPLRAEICLRGFFGPDGEKAERVARIVAYRGKPHLGLSLTWVNRRDPEEHVIGNLAFVLPLRNGRRASATMDGKPRGLGAGGHIWQKGPHASVAGGVEGKRWGGWADAGGILLALRKHWQNYPTGFEVANNGNAVLHLWDGGGERVLDLSTSLSPERWNRRPTRLGMAKTYRLGLLLHGKEAPAGGASRKAAELLQPLRLVADPKWVCASDVGGPLHPYDPERFPECERAFHDLFEGVVLQQRAYDLYGAMDYGDFHSRWRRRKPEEDSHLAYRKGWDWYRYWMNNESTGSSTTIHLWLQYLRTMKRRYFDLVADRTRHLMDVDTCHYSREMPEHPVVEYSPVDVVGCQYNHDFYHWSGWPKVHHTKADDILLYYHLTGDERALDVAKEMADMMKVLQLGRFGGGSIRVLSVPGRLAFNLYRQFWDPDLLQYNRDAWETMRAYCGAGDRVLMTFGEYHRYTGDERFLREWLSTSVVNEDVEQPALSEIIDGYIGPSQPAHARNHSARMTEAWFSTRDRRSAVPLAKGFYSRGNEFARSSVTYRLRAGADPDLYGVGSLPDAVRDDGKGHTPMGYGWTTWGAGKYAYSLRALVESEMIRPTPAGTVTAKATGGNWTDPAAWEGGKAPGPDHDVVIPAGSVVAYDGPAIEARTCRSISIDGRLRVAQGQHTLVPAGDVVVATNAVFEMGPGSALLFDSNFSGEFGLKNSGLIRFRGTSPEKRDCRVGALRDDGMHNAYIHVVSSTGSGIIENCELFRLGVGSPRAERPDHNPKLGIVFRGVATANYMRLAGNEIHHSVVGIYFYKSHGAATHSEDERISGNVIHHCDVGIMSHRLANGINRLIVSANRIHDNKTGFLHQAGCEIPGSAVITKNRFEKNDVAFHLTTHGSRQVQIIGNTYLDNDIAIVLDCKGAKFENETISGGRVGVKLDQAGGGRLVNCRIGVEKPNAKANVLAAEAAKRALVLQGCTLGGPTRIAGNEAAVVVLDALPQPGSAVDTDAAAGEEVGLEDLE